MEKLKIFISGTQDDMKPERDAVDRAVNSTTLSTGIRAETAASQPQSPRAWIEQQLRECSIYIGVYSHRYGWVIPGEDVSATEFEFNLARKLGKPILVWIRKLRDEEKSKPNMDRQEQFLNRVSDFSMGHLRQEFDNPTDLEKWVTAALGETFTEIIRRGTSSSFSKFLVPFRRNSIVEGMNLLPYDYDQRIQNFLIEYLGTDAHPVPFGGRDKALRMLDTWLSETTPYLLLAAPAGRGKSALLVRWLDSLKVREDLSVAFVPVSIRFGTNMERVFYAALAARLAFLHGDDVPASPETSTSVYRGLVSDYLSKPLANGRTLLVVLDGLDEAADWQAGADFMPFDVPARVRVVVSMRFLAGDVDSTPWLRRLNWERNELASVPSLTPLDQEGVRDVLFKMGYPLDELSRNVDIVSELYRLSAGDPLLVGLYVGDLWAKGDEATRLKPEDLAGLQPGYKGYFDRWWDDQKKLWGKNKPWLEKHVRVVRNLLAGALGPLFKPDFQSLSPELESDYIADALDVLQRFIIGDNQSQGYTFSHPKLGNYFWDELIENEQTELENRFLVWGESIMQSLITEKIKPHETPHYLIQYYSAHLERTHASVDKFILLVEHPNWAQAWFAYEGSYGGFLRDVRIVLQHSEDAIRNSMIDNSIEKRKIAFVGQIRCGLCYSSITTLSRNVSTDLLPLALEYGLISQTQALAIAKGIQKDEMFVSILISLFPFFEGGIIGAVLDVIQDISSENVRSSALVNIYPHLSSELKIEAFNIIQSIRDPNIKANSIAYIAQALPEELVIDILDNLESMEVSYQKAFAIIKISERFSDEMNGKIIDLAIDTALSINSPDEQARALIDLLPYIQNKQDDQLMETVLQTAIKAIKSPNYEVTQARYLAQIAPYLKDKFLETVLHDAWALERTDAKIHALAGILPYLSPLLKKDNMVKALKEAQSIKTPEKYSHIPIKGMAYKSNAELRGPIPRMGRTFTGGRTHSLLDLLPVLSDDLKQEAIRNTVSAIEELLDEYAKSIYLADLLKYVPDDEKETLLKLAQAIRSEDDRVHALCEFAPHLSPSLLEVLLRAVLLVQSQDARAYALASIASYFLDDRKGEITKIALEAAYMVEDEYTKGKILTKLIPNLPVDLRESILRNALKSTELIADESAQARALARIIPCVPNKLKDDIAQVIYKLALNIKRKDNRAEAIIEMLSFIPWEIKNRFLYEVINSVSTIPSDDDRAYIIADVVSQIPDELKLELLKTVLNITYEPTRAYALSMIAFCLPEDALPELFKSALGISNIVARLYALARLIPRTKNPQREELLQIALGELEAITDEQDRASAISDFAPYFSTIELSQAIIIAENIIDTESRVQALSKLASYVDSEKQHIILQEALNTIVSISDEHSRAMAIESISSLLTADQKAVAIEIIRSIKFDNYRLGALYAVIPYLANDLEYDLLLDAIGDIGGGYAAITLGKMAKFLPENKKSRLLDVVKKIRYDETRAFALQNIVPFLMGNEKEDAVQLAQESAGNYDQDRYQVEHLISLFPHISGNKKYKLLQLAFHKSAELDERWLTPVAGKLAEYSIEWFDKEPIDAINAWLVLLPAIIKFNREEFLHIFSALFPLLTHFNFDMKADFVKETSTAIQEVCTWWS